MIGLNPLLMSSEFNKGWYVVYVKSRHEKKVDKLLSDINIQTYLPLVKRVKKWSDRKKVVHEPLIPSYVFVYINKETDFSKIMSVYGTCGFIRFGRKFARVRDEELKNIRILLAGDLKDVVSESTTSLLKVGETQRIQYGLLSGLECTILKINDVNKIQVRIDSINMQIMATVPINYLVTSLTV